MTSVWLHSLPGLAWGLPQPPSDMPSPSLPAAETAALNVSHLDCVRLRTAPGHTASGRRVSAPRRPSRPSSPRGSWLSFLLSSSLTASPSSVCFSSFPAPQLRDLETVGVSSVPPSSPDQRDLFLRQGHWSTLRLLWAAASHSSPLTTTFCQRNFVCGGLVNVSSLNWLKSATCLLGQ